MGTANDVVTDTREVLDATTANENDRVLLKVVTDARNVGGDLNSVRESDTSDLSKRRVGLLGRLCSHNGTYATSEGISLQRRRLGLDHG